MTKDTEAAVALAAPGIIAGIEDSMATDDKDNEENAAQPATAKITRCHRPIRQTHTFANLANLGQRVEVRVAQNDLSPVIITCSFLNAGQ